MGEEIKLDRYPVKLLLAHVGELIDAELSSASMSLVVEQDLLEVSNEHFEATLLFLHTGVGLVESKPQTSPYSINRYEQPHLETKSENSIAK